MTNKRGRGWLRSRVRIRKSIRLTRRVRVNLTQSWPTVTLKAGLATVNVGVRGARITVRLGNTGAAQEYAVGWGPLGAALRGWLARRGARGEPAEAVLGEPE